MNFFIKRIAVLEPHFLMSCSHVKRPQYRTNILVHSIKSKFGHCILKYLQIICYNTKNTWIGVF